MEYTQKQETEGWTESAGRRHRSSRRRKVKAVQDLAASQKPKVRKVKKVLADGSEPEKFIQRRILDWLKESGQLHWRQNSGTVMFGYRKILLGEEGLPDIIVVVPPNGRLLGLEVKSAKGKQRPAQVVMERRMAAAGAVYRVVRSLKQAQDAVAFTIGDSTCRKTSAPN